MSNFKIFGQKFLGCNLKCNANIVHNENTLKEKIICLNGFSFVWI